MGMPAPYGLLFEGLGADRVQGWTGEWPPPEVFWVCTGALTGGVAFAEPDRIPPDDRDELAGSSISVRVFTRRSYSEADPAQNEHIWPCAQYVEEGWVYEGGGHLRKETL